MSELVDNKIWELDEETVKFIETVVAEETPYLSTIGLKFKYFGVIKQPNVIKISKPSNLVKYLSDGQIELVVNLYEQAFERLDNATKKLVIANSFDSIEYNSENDKVNILNNYGTALSEGMYLKHREPLVLALFAGDHAIKQIEEEAKEAKASKKSKKSY